MVIGGLAEVVVVVIGYGSWGVAVVDGVVGGIVIEGCGSSGCGI